MELFEVVMDLGETLVLLWMFYQILWLRRRYEEEGEKNNEEERRGKRKVLSETQ